MILDKRLVIISGIVLLFLFTLASLIEVSQVNALAVGNGISGNISIVASNSSLELKGDVAYIYRSQRAIDNNVVNAFNNLGLKVDFVNENNLTSLAGYNLIFVNDERFTKPIPIENYNSVVSNYYLGYQLGLTDADGMSRLSSREPLMVNFKGNFLQVYNSAIDQNREYLAYYYIDKNNKAGSLRRYAGTYSSGSGSNFGDVISLVEKGSILHNGKKAQGRICFYGVIDSSFWTENAKNLFNDCVNYVGSMGDSEVIICSNDNECTDNIDSTKDVCVNPNTGESYCVNNERNSTSDISCFNDLNCEDGDLNTNDLCLNAGALNSVCIHNPAENLDIVDLNSTSTNDSIFVSFNISGTNNILNISVNNVFIKKDNESWINLTKDTRNYTFINLSSATNYTIYVKLTDSLNRSSSENSILASTQTNQFNQNVTNNSSGNSGGGGSSGGSNGESSGGSGGGGGSSVISISGQSITNSLSPGFSFCSNPWICDDWSECTNGTQKRTCSYDLKKCKPDLGLKPDEIIRCEPDSSGGTRSNETVPPLQSPQSNVFGITGAAIRDFVGKPTTWALIVVVLGVIIGAVYYYRKNKLADSGNKIKPKVEKVKS